MNTKQFLVIFFLFGLSVVNAQSFRFGGKIGYVNSFLTLEDFGGKMSSKAKSNAYLGVQGEYFFNKYIAAQAEITIAGLGGQKVITSVETEGKTFEGAMDLHLATCNFPIGFKIYPARRFAVLGGLGLGIISQAITEAEGQKIKLTNIKTGNHALFFGGEYRFVKNFFVEMRYNIGISNINTALPIIHSNYFQIGIGHFFKSL